eukprot:2305962-Prymnesium_polylepis.1
MHVHAGERAEHLGLYEPLLPLLGLGRLQRLDGLEGLRLLQPVQVVAQPLVAPQQERARLHAHHRGERVAPLRVQHIATLFVARRIVGGRHRVLDHAATLQTGAHVALFELATLAAAVTLDRAARFERLAPLPVSLFEPVPSVAHRIVGAAGQSECDERPATAALAHALQDERVLGRRPWRHLRRVAAAPGASPVRQVSGR